jgi:flavin-dependent dehydrogenase
MENQNLELEDGSRIGVIGGGPAGSFFSIFVLDMAHRMGIDLHVDIYEPRDYKRPGPIGCNMCGGIISETLVQNLATEGINLPPSVVQRGIDSYVLHMDVGSVRIDTPLHEKRIGAVHRGPGPRDVKEIKWESFDGHLQSLALERGAKVIQERVTEIERADGKFQIRSRKGSPKTYDLLAIATGINTGAMRLFNDLDLSYKPPTTTKTFICEFFLGLDQIGEILGSSMHVFLLDLPRLEFAAIIPKGEYASVCMLGEEIDTELITSFMGAPEVKERFPPQWDLKVFNCQCSPRIAMNSAHQPFADRIVFIGDIGVTRLYKDGIGAAYRAAKAAATTVIFQGISSADFKEYYWPTCRNIEMDNNIGKMIFMVTGLIQKFRFARRAVLRMTAAEQQADGPQKRMSTVLWDTFTGSAPYREIFLRTLHPAFLLRLFGHLTRSLFN